MKWQVLIGIRGWGKGKGSPWTGKGYWVGVGVRSAERSHSEPGSQYAIWYMVIGTTVSLLSRSLWNLPVRTRNSTPSHLGGPVLEPSGCIYLLDTPYSYIMLCSLLPNQDRESQMKPSDH